MKRRKMYLTPFSALLFVTLLVSCSQPTSPSANPDLTKAYTAYFNDADTDGSGTLEQPEIDTSIDSDFDKLDYTGDGVVTLDDIYNAEQGEPEGAERNTDLSAHLPYDANGNGTIIREEHRAHVESLISKMDTDGNGQISMAEYRTFKEF